MGTNVAALDCGTNSTRLLITDPSGVTLERVMTITRLGQGVDESGELSEEAIARVFAALERYRTIMDTFDVSRARMACTSAVRDARNGAAFLERASDLLRCEVSVLTGDEEAALSFAGAVADAPPAQIPRLVVDIGGGSTELVLEVGGHLESVSLQLGCVRLTERCLHSNPTTDVELIAAKAAIAEQFERIERSIPSLSLQPQVQIIGLAGTVASLVLLEHELETYVRDQVHHQILDREVVQRWITTLSNETNAERRGHRGMEPGRADVLLGGLLVLDAIMERVGAKDLLTSESDILDGLAASLR